MFKNAVLIRPPQQHPIIDLPSHHYAALSAFADKHRRSAEYVTLKGPLVRCWIIQSLTRDAWPLMKRLVLVDAPQLGPESICHLRNQLSLKELSVVDCFFDAAVLLKFSMGWLQHLRLRFEKISLMTMLCQS